MVVAARGGRSGVRECIRSCLALLLPSLSLLLLPSSPLSHLSLFCFLSQKNIPIVSWNFTSFKLFVQICCNLPFIFVLKIDYLFLMKILDFPRSQWYGYQYVFLPKCWFSQFPQLEREPLRSQSPTTFACLWSKHKHLGSQSPTTFAYLWSKHEVFENNITSHRVIWNCICLTQKRFYL